MPGPSSSCSRSSSRRCSRLDSRIRDLPGTAPTPRPRFRSLSTRCARSTPHQLPQEGAVLPTPTPQVVGQTEPDATVTVYDSDCRSARPGVRVGISPFCPPCGSRTVRTCSPRPPPIALGGSLPHLMPSQSWFGRCRRRIPLPAPVGNSSSRPCPISRIRSTHLRVKNRPSRQLSMSGQWRAFAGDPTTSNSSCIWNGRFGHLAQVPRLRCCRLRRRFRRAARPSTRRLPPPGTAGTVQEHWSTLTLSMRTMSRFGSSGRGPDLGVVPRARPARTR